ncbi:MAG: transglycosylase SLT domain-containing protein [Bacteriovoracaceae bacterium]|nr:transglycosylase SLT domain-containing protein [Bacteriovoracaceae bacterium]
MISMLKDLHLLLTLCGVLMIFFSLFYKEEKKTNFERMFLLTIPLVIAFSLLWKFSPVSAPGLEHGIEKFETLISGSTGAVFETIVRKTSSKQVITKTYQSLSSNMLWIGIFLTGLTIWGFLFIRDIFRLRKIIGNAHQVKFHKKTKILVSENLGSPCSLWWPGNYLILVPSSVLQDKDLLHYSLKHEFIHHKLGDTKSIYLIQLIKAFFFLNPFAHFFVRKIGEQIEYRCDRKVVDHNRKNSIKYAKSILKIASKNSGISFQPTCAMASLKLLKWRIKMISMNEKKSRTPLKTYAALILSSVVLLQTAFAISSDSRHILSLEQASDIAHSYDSKIPIEVNEEVLKWLNFYIGDPRGRSFMKKAMVRMKNYQGFILGKLGLSKLPLELLAVPLMESGFSNKAISGNGAAGIWQFMPGTARRFGLVVKKGHDERFNVGKLTAAAISYYQSLYKIPDFQKDWRLAILSYNTGESRLKKEIENRGTLDPWAFSDIGDKQYLAKIMAGIIILKNPKKFQFKGEFALPETHVLLEDSLGIRSSEQTKLCRKTSNIVENC